MRPAFLGIDLGTSGVKTILLDAAGQILGEAAHTYPVTSPFRGAAEADTAQWWDATRAAVHEVLARAGDAQIIAAGVDGQMHGLVLVDQEGRALRTALTWADTRADKQTERWHALPAAARARLANPITPGMTGPLLAWIAEHEPSHLDQAATLLLPKDWLRLQLTGQLATDPSDASATLLWDIPGDHWATDLMPTLQLPGPLLPPVRSSTQVAGELTGPVAHDLGLPAGLVVAAGAADTAAALHATGLTPGDTLLTVGTGAQILQPLTAPHTTDTPVTHLYRAAEPHRWYAMAAVQNAGLALDWVRQTLAASWNELYSAVNQPPDPHDPVFLPFLTGERTPLLDTHIRATWSGLDISHDRQPLLRAAAIGVCCAIRHALTHLPGSEPAQIHVAGGGTRDPAMRQLLANILQLPLTQLPIRNASPSGAARLAAAAAGQPLAPPHRTRTPSIEPEPKRTTYETAYEAYLAAVNRTINTPR